MPAPEQPFTMQDGDWFPTFDWDKINSMTDDDWKALAEQSPPVSPEAPASPIPEITPKIAEALSSPLPILPDPHEPDHVPRHFKARCCATLSPDYQLRVKCSLGDGPVFDRTIDISSMVHYVHSKMIEYHRSLHGDTSVSGLGDLLRDAVNAVSSVVSNKTIQSIFDDATPLLPLLPGGTVLATAVKIHDVIIKAKNGDDASKQVLSTLKTAAASGDPAAQQAMNAATKINDVLNAKAVKAATSTAGIISSGLRIGSTAPRVVSRSTGTAGQNPHTTSPTPSQIVSSNRYIDPTTGQVTSLPYAMNQSQFSQAMNATLQGQQAGPQNPYGGGTPGYNPYYGQPPQQPYQQPYMPPPPPSYPDPSQYYGYPPSPSPYVDPSQYGYASPYAYAPSPYGYSDPYSMGYNPSPYGMAGGYPTDYSQVPGHVPGDDYGGSENPYGYQFSGWGYNRPYRPQGGAGKGLRDLYNLGLAS